MGTGDKQISISREGEISGKTASAVLGAVSTLCKKGQVGKITVECPDSRKEEVSGYAKRNGVALESIVQPARPEPKARAAKAPTAKPQQEVTLESKAPTPRGPGMSPG